MSKEFKVPEQWSGDLYFFVQLPNAEHPYRKAGSILMRNCDLELDDEVFIHKHAVTVDLPQKIDFRKCAVDSLKNAKEKVLAEAQVKANEIQEKIDSLLMITYEAAE